MPTHELRELLARHFSGPESIHHDRRRFRDADRIRDLNFAAICEAGGHDVLGHITRRVSGRAIDLGWILAGERAAAVARKSAVGVDNDLAASEAAVADGTADDEPPGRIDVELGALVQPFLRQHRQHDFFHHGFAQLFGADVVAVLGGEHDGLDADGLVVFITQRDLALGIRPKPGELAALAHLGLFLDEAVRERDRSGHQHVRFVRGETEHQALVASALLAFVLAIHAHRDVRRLLADDVQHAAARAVEAHLGAVVADVEHRLADQRFDVHPGIRGDFARDDDDARLDQGFAGDATALVLLQDGVEHRVRNLIGDLVRMTFRHGLGGEQIAV